MAETFGMTNVQHLLGDTDFDNGLLPDEDVKEEKNERQVPADKQPFVNSISDLLPSGSQAPMNENSLGEKLNSPPRAMRAAAWTSYERRIY